MKTLKEIIIEARQKKSAIGQFNISTLEAFWAVVRATEKTKQPVIIGLSEGEMDFFGVKQARVLVDSVRAEKGLEIFLNADHVHSLAGARLAMENKFDAITFDGSSLSLAENIKLTRECVALAKELNSPILIEGDALRIHPCICAGFNADFDGDQMAIHVPLSAKSKEEAISLMMAARNLVRPADGSPITLPNKEMALGAYYLTSIDPTQEEYGNIFESEDEVLTALSTRKI
ncbi:MAG: DNA-directed RNA polymerase subunit beta', DNA-directed RNA polymerase subunit beta', partial [Parcubacteria group bacterium GW2011_GWC1_43_11b]